MRALLAQGERVVVVDQTTAGNTLDLLIPAAQRDERLHVLSGLVTDGWSLLRCCRRYRVDRIVHLASPLTQAVTDDLLGGLRTICTGTATVFETALAADVRKVVWMSSVAIFGASSEYGNQPVANDACHRPLGMYGACKSLCEQMAAHYRDHNGLDSIGLRLSLVYGAGRQRGYMTFASELIRSASLGLPIEIPIADQPIHWQYVEEVALMVLASLAADRTEDLCFNPCGETRPFRVLGETLAGLEPNLRVDYASEPRNDGEDALCTLPHAYDDTAFRDQLGYAPRFTLETGTRRAFEAYRSFAAPGAAT